MPGVQLQMPFDIILSAVGLDHKDIENRMHLTQTVSHDPSGREVLRVFDRMGNASSRMIIPDVRGTRYPAATLWWDTRFPLKSQISIGNSETLTVDAWLSKVSLANRLPCRGFVASDGRSYRWINVERGVWHCINEHGHRVSEASDDEYRTVSVDQNSPYLGVEIFISFLILYRLNLRA